MSAECKIFQKKPSDGGVCCSKHFFSQFVDQNKLNILIDCPGLIASSCWTIKDLDFQCWPGSMYCVFGQDRRLFCTDFTTQARVVRKVDNAIHWINHYPVDSTVCFVNAYPLYSDLFSG